MLRIPGAETGVLCGGTVSKEAAEDSPPHDLRIFLRLLTPLTITSIYREVPVGGRAVPLIRGIPGAETGVLCGGTVSKEAAEDAYRHLTFSSKTWGI